MIPTNNGGFSLFAKRLMFAVSLSLIPFSGNATCFQLLDRHGSEIYRAKTPPWSIAFPSEDTTQRDESRARGEHLIQYEDPDCPRENVIANQKRPGSKGQHRWTDAVATPHLGKRPSDSVIVPGDALETPPPKSKIPSTSATQDPLDLRKQAAEKALQRWRSQKDERSKQWEEERQLLLSQPRDPAPKTVNTYPPDISAYCRSLNRKANQKTSHHCLRSQLEAKERIRSMDPVGSVIRRCGADKPPYTSKEFCVERGIRGVLPRRSLP
jgi:hypothetical protein